MITIDKPISLPDTYPLNRIGSLDDLLFFDIETTGFSGDYSNLYLIGCTYYKNDSWHLIQWFADTRESEPELLHAFFRFLKNYKILVHFNGDGFDIPYLLKRCKFYGFPYDFSQVESFDIYRKIKPYRYLLQLDSLKQKSIECFLGINREDTYNGGQLIEVYHDYLRSHDDYLYQLLILHNEDDLKGMPQILPILNYPDFFEHPFELVNQAIESFTDIFGDPYRSLMLTCKSRYRIPVPVERSLLFAACRAEDDLLLLSIGLFDGCLKHFYPNYKDYYYLIYEDTAIHKSVGEFVDKDARKKATPKTCYTKKNGCFLPQFEPVWEPYLQSEYKSKVTYIEYEDALFNEPDKFEAYLRQLIAQLLSKSSN
ncbi:MAG: ribonuclease H-like domain-containing protein [Clostridiaceae bacterium]|nr:ribonuclease H-like domain-containing protein [Clostridiaceae bacterium]